MKIYRLKINNYLIAGLNHRLKIAGWTGSIIDFSEIRVKIT